MDGVDIRRVICIIKKKGTLDVLYKKRRKGTYLYHHASNFVDAFIAPAIAGTRRGQTNHNNDLLPLSSTTMTDTDTENRVI